MHSRDYMKTDSDKIISKLHNSDENSTKRGTKYRTVCKDFFKKKTSAQKSFTLSKAKSRIKNIRKKFLLKFHLKSNNTENSVNIRKDELPEANSNKTNTIDFGCQSSLNSNCSMEIISHVLTRSLSQLSSVESLNFKLWRRNQPKQTNAIQVFAYYLMRKFKHSNSKITRRSKYNISVLGVSQILNENSADTVFSNQNKFKSHEEYPIKIDDKDTKTVRTVMRREK